MGLLDKFTVSGSPEQVALILPVLEGMYLGFKELEEKLEELQTGNRLNISPEFDDLLQLTLHWKGIIVGTKKWHRTEMSVRLKGVDPRTRSLDYFQSLARVVLSKFNNLNYQSGKIKCKYTNWKDGFQSWGYHTSAIDGYRILEVMGDIVNKSIDKKLFRYENVLDAAGAFDSTPEKVQLAGQLVKTKVKAPTANMQCYKATILFPWIRHREQLCRVNGYIIPNLNFLDAYNGTE